MDNGNKWLRATVAKGLAQLVVLRLSNQPPQEMITATAEVWVKAILSQKIYGGWQEQEDRWRIEEAFIKLCAEFERFPAPKHLIEKMPKRKVLELPAPELKPLSDDKRKMYKENCRKLRAILKGVRVKNEIC